MEHTNGVFDWSNTFNSPLEMNKLALVNFTQSATKSSSTTDLTLSQHTQGETHIHHIKASLNAKLLGVLLDSKLNWNTQHEKVHEKVVKWTAAFKCFTRPALGIHIKEARKLYKAVAIPKICYAADIWFTPSRSAKANSIHAGPIKITNRLKSIQRQAAISITGALRTTPGDATLAHANLTPIGLQLKDTGTKAYLRLASRASSHRQSRRQSTQTPGKET